METLLVFFAIIAIQMIAAYTSKQKKEASKPVILPPPTRREPVKQIQKIIRVPAKEEPVLEEPKVEIKKTEITKKEEKPIHQFSILHSQLNIKDPAQGILWNAILHEPRYRVKWKRR